MNADVVCRWDVACYVVGEPDTKDRMVTLGQWVASATVSLPGGRRVRVAYGLPVALVGARGAFGWGAAGELTLWPDAPTAYLYIRLNTLQGGHDMKLALAQLRHLAGLYLDQEIARLTELRADLNNHEVKSADAASAIRQAILHKSKSADRTYKGQHWTQQPKNRARMLRMVRKAAAKRHQQERAQ